MPLYDAISYAWGGEVFSHQLWIDVHGGSSTQLSITANLADALCHFRFRDMSRFLWADAICIDQRDDTEKSTHITLMTDIYRVAANVLVWLGRGDKVERIFARIKKIGRLLQTSSFTVSRSRDDSLMEMVHELVSLPWFSRRWVIQDVVLNPNVTFHYNKHQPPFIDLCLAIVSLTSLAWETSSTVGAVVAMFELWKTFALKQQSQGKCTFLRLL